MKVHQPWRLVAVVIVIALAAVVAFAAGCQTSGTGPTLPAPIGIELERAKR